MLVGMPAPRDLHRSEVDGQVFVAVGATVLFSYAADDAGLRNLAAVTLPEMGFTGRRVAQVLGITEEYVSMLRARTRREGSAGLMRRRGRPSALRAGDLSRARSWRAAGQTDAAIGDRLGVHATTVARALAGVERPGSAGGAEQTILTEPGLPEPVLTEPVLTEPGLTEPVLTEPGLTEPGLPEPVLPEPVLTEPVLTEPGLTEPVGPPVGPFTGSFTGSARVATGAGRCRYAGAMLLYPYLDSVGAEGIFATLTGGPARRYDDLAVLTTATLGFALGVDTVEGTKHLRRTEAGAAVGLAMVPQLATLRARLSALADTSDPLQRQRVGGVRHALRRSGRRPGLLRRRPLRALQRRPSGRQGMGHQTSPRPARPRGHAADRCPRPGRGLRFRGTFRADLHPARRAHRTPRGPRPGRPGAARL